MLAQSSKHAGMAIAVYAVPIGSGLDQADVLTAMALLSSRSSSLADGPSIGCRLRGGLVVATSSFCKASPEQSFRQVCAPLISCKLIFTGSAASCCGSHLQFLRVGTVLCACDLQACCEGCSSTPDVACWSPEDAHQDGQVGSVCTPVECLALPVWPRPDDLRVNHADALNHPSQLNAFCGCNHVVERNKLSKTRAKKGEDQEKPRVVTASGQTLRVESPPHCLLCPLLSCECSILFIKVR